MNFKNVMMVGGFLAVSLNMASALSATEKKIARAGARALLHSTARVKNEAGVVLVDQSTQQNKAPVDVAMDMLIGDDKERNVRKISTNEICRLEQQVNPETGRYQCAFCVSFKDGSNTVLEKLLYKATISGDDSFYTADIDSSTIQWVDRHFPNRDELCTSAD